MITRKSICSLGLLGAVVSAVTLVFFSLELGVNPSQNAMTTPWSSVGGCGGGGSGGGSADGIKWIGNGVSGGLIDVEVLPKLNFGQNFKSFTIAPRISFKPVYTVTVGLSMPIQSKSGEVQFMNTKDPYDRHTGGTGDLSLDIARSFGISGQYSMSFALSIPTGQYDIKRGSWRENEKEQKFLPASLQKGGGVYSATLGLSYTKDVEGGMWLYDASYSHPFNLKLSGENEFLDEYFANEKKETRETEFVNEANEKRFYYTFKPYGENDLGAYSPPSISGSVAYAYRKVDGMTLSWGIAFGVPLGVAWVHSEDPGVYNPKPDPDHQTWSAAFAYGMEFQRENFPIFMAVSLPIHAKTAELTHEDDPYDVAPLKKVKGPDWSDFGQQWTFAVGFKARLF